MKTSFGKSRLSAWLLVWAAVATMSFLSVRLLCSDVGRASLREILAGWVAGIAGLLVVYPLDTAKVCIQSSRAGAYSGVLDVMRKVVRERGACALYRGVLSPAIGCGVIFGTTFCTYAVATEIIRTIRDDDGLRPNDIILAGFASGIVSSIPRAAFERVKSVMQVSQLPGARAPHSTSLQCLKHILRTEGLVGLFRGVPSTMAREGPQQATYFPVYFATGHLLMALGAADVLPAVMLQLIPGACAGIATWLPPFIWVDAVNTRMQTMSNEDAVGFVECACHMYRAQGAAHFNKGLAAALARAAPLHATIFVVHNIVTTWLSTAGL